MLRLHFASGGVVCLIERTLLRAVNAEDGSELWRYESKAEARGSGSTDSRQLEQFFIDGHVWVRAARGTGGRDAPEPWLALAPLSGEARWTNRIDEAYYGMCDPLVTDGASIYLEDRRIDPKTGEVTAVEGFS